MKFDLTLRKIKNTNFSALYNRFIINESLSVKELEVILSIAICFINAKDNKVQQLGYRIIVHYCNQSHNYEPLYEIAINKGLYPISKFIEDHYMKNVEKNFFTEWNDAFTSQYHYENIYQTQQQHSLKEFFSNDKNKSLMVVAPTSYGKSELIEKLIQEFKGKNICILTSTKALLMQTKQRIRKSIKLIYPKIIVYPEMYNPSDQSCLAILTQERLLRLFKMFPELKFDCMIVDEAHEMLGKDARSVNLVNMIIVAEKRNPNIVFKFLTPFLEDSNSLKTKYTTYNLMTFKVSEYVKTEYYYLYDLRNQSGLKLYDQFLNAYINCSGNDSLKTEEDVVKHYSLGKNIIYLNKPTDIEKFGLSLADILPDIESDIVQEACKQISEYINPHYNLLRCLKKGIIYHHGSVPDSIRIYIEKLYKEEKKIKYVITSSTLLAGVNLPADRMFILDNKKGKNNLTHDAFKNLVGRVCRFNDIFGENGSLTRLEPSIFLVFGKYFSSRANCVKFLSDVAKTEIVFEDKVNNVLLQKTEINDKNRDELNRATEFLENFEKGVVEEYKQRYAHTDVGKFCIMNGITEFDVFDNEEEIQNNVNYYLEDHEPIKDTDTLMTMMNFWFFNHFDKVADKVNRLKYMDARSFYKMMLDWRIYNKSYSEMIDLFVNHWYDDYKENEDALEYVSKWGDTCRPGGNLPHYIKVKGKNRFELINLAIVRIKEEQDFVDNILIKFIETLHDLNLLEENFYYLIKYGTDNEKVICLLKNGLSSSVALLLVKKYERFIKFNIQANYISINKDIIEQMEKMHENKINILELKNFL